MADDREPTPDSACAPPAPTTRQRWRRRLGGWLVNLVLIVAIVVGVQWWKGRTLVTGEAPPLVGRTVDGTSIDLADWRGRPVLVHFWATWCPVCRITDGTIDAIANDHAVVTVALQSGTEDEIRAYMREAGQDFRVVLDPDGRLARTWGVAGVPTSFVIDGDGRIRSSIVGVSTGLGLRLRLWLAGR
ncbi:protein disulfide oxidoreductase [Allochromatium humboldtianum]|uniref:Protein disulfide oxidoreductase n=1 Tax=Allochromatium humboldtianum TaxID=504901 RepID=A0A850R9G0_9GAMM|nr:protein disulfide oxidoreductase [Allochromatium humboldtianum]NVZ07912.1 protein disulfide oxidoreductase [Allochromatium humboldtianum]